MANFQTMDFSQGPDPENSSPGSGAPPGGYPAPYKPPVTRAPSTDNPYWPYPNETPTPPPTAPPTTPPATPPPTTPPPTTGGGGGLDPNAVVAGWMTGNNPQGHQDAAYWTRRMAETGGLTAANLEYWKGRFMEAPGTHVEGPAGGGYGGTNVFSDPASQEWEKLLNSLVGKLNTNYTPPGFAPMIDQLTKYFQQLQGPAYTPAQMDLIQTQSTDPLMQSRDHARQQILQNFASRGMDPNSPIVQSALEQSDQKYGVANTQAQAGFATNAIGLDRQNAATAAQVGPQIAGLQQGLYNYNLGNAGQAVNYANQVPTTAWNRLTGANSLIQPLNPSALIGQQQYGQQVGYGQSNDYTQILMQLLSQLFR